MKDCVCCLASPDARPPCHAHHTGPPWAPSQLRRTTTPSPSRTRARRRCWRPSCSWRAATPATHARSRRFAPLCRRPRSRWACLRSCWRLVGAAIILAGGWLWVARWSDDLQCNPQGSSCSLMAAMLFMSAGDWAHLQERGARTEAAGGAGQQAGGCRWWLAVGWVSTGVCPSLLLCVPQPARPTGSLLSCIYAP